MNGFLVLLIFAVVIFVMGALIAVVAELQKNLYDHASPGSGKKRMPYNMRFQRTVRDDTGTEVVFDTLTSEIVWWGKFDSWTYYFLKNESGHFWYLGYPYYNGRVPSKINFFVDEGYAMMIFKDAQVSPAVLDML